MVPKIICSVVLGILLFSAVVALVTRLADPPGDTFTIPPFRSRGGSPNNDWYKGDNYSEKWPPNWLGEDELGL